MHIDYRPGDNDNNLLRKILERLNTGISLVSSGDVPEGVPLVAVANFPLLQQVYGAVSVNNFPATQPVSVASLPLPAGAATEATLRKIEPDPYFHASVYQDVAGRAAAAWHVLGRRAGFNSTSVLQDVAEYLTGNIFVPLNGTETLEVVSSSIQDDPALPGTGTHSVTIVFLNTSYAIVSATVNLNGTTPVNLGGTRMLFVYYMEATAGGSGETSVGNIDLRIAGGGAIQERITAGGNRSLSGRFMVPDGYSAFISGWHVTTQGVNFTADARLRATPGTGTRFVFQDSLFCSGNGGTVDTELPWIKKPARSIIKPSIFASATGATNRVDIDFTILLLAEP